MHLALSYHSNKESAVALATEIKAAYKVANPEKRSPTISLHHANLANPKHTVQLCKDAEDVHKRPVDILVANAGVGRRVTEIECAFI